MACNLQSTRLLEVIGISVDELSNGSNIAPLAPKCNSGRYGVGTTYLVVLPVVRSTMYYYHPPPVRTALQGALNKFALSGGGDMGKSDALSLLPMDGDP